MFLAEIKGPHKASSATGEGSYDALSKYGVDLIALAEAGKLDPVRVGFFVPLVGFLTLGWQVIGRDDEIRRVVQILARRTKNNPVLIGEPGWWWWWVGFFLWFYLLFYYLLLLFLLF